ncbi:MAG: hypothetical protein ACQEQC_08850, partial [Elusimicrobiota bacterium]
MKKVILAIVGVFSVITAVQAQQINFGGVNVSVGYDSVPGKFYYIENVAEYEDGSISKSRETQGEEEFRSGMVSLRVSKMSSIMNATLDENLSAGIEVGASLPISGLDKSWELPADPDNDYTGTVRGPSTFLATDYKQTRIQEAELSIFPILGKVSYGINENNTDIGADINIGFGLGAYILNISETVTESENYVQDSAGGIEKQGDEIKEISPREYSEISPGGEINLQISQGITEDISAGATGRVGIIAAKKSLSFTENTDYYQIDWTPEDETLTTMKEGREYGGISYGFNV